jgi:hypothetical protein
MYSYIRIVKIWTFKGSHEMDYKIRKASIEIVALSVNNNDTIGGLFDKFFDIMRRHGIKRGTRSKDGVGILCDNIEWTVCRTLFTSHIADALMMDFVLGIVPEDLKAYDEPPATDRTTITNEHPDNMS